MANRQVFQLTTKASSSINLTDVIPVQPPAQLVEAIGIGSEAVKVTVQSLQNFTLQQPVASASLHTTSSATTASLAYGINIVYTSSYINNSTKLPSATIGSTVTVINSSNNTVNVFPQTGGKINKNRVNIPFTVPADNLAYTFTCYSVSGSSTIGNWSTNTSQNSNVKTLRYPTMAVHHVSGSGGVYYYGTGFQNITGSASGSGLAWTGSYTQSALIPYTVFGQIGPNYSNALVPSASEGGGRQLVWRSETLPTTAKKLRVYTNITGSDLAGSNSVQVGLIRTYQVDQGDMAPYQQSATITFTTGSPDNTLASPTFRILSTANIFSSSYTPLRPKNAGTLWGEVVLPADTQIGSQTTNYGPYYYTFAMLIGSGSATKNYLFDFEIDYI